MLSYSIHTHKKTWKCELKGIFSLISGMSIFIKWNQTISSTLEQKLQLIHLVGGKHSINVHWCKLILLKKHFQRQM